MMESEKLLALVRSLFPQESREDEMVYFSRIQNCLTPDERNLVAAELSFEQDRRLYSGL